MRLRRPAGRRAAAAPLSPSEIAPPSRHLRATSWRAGRRRSSSAAWPRRCHPATRVRSRGPRRRTPRARMPCGPDHRGVARQVARQAAIPPDRGSRVGPGVVEDRGVVQHDGLTPGTPRRPARQAEQRARACGSVVGSHRWWGIRAGPTCRTSMCRSGGGATPGGSSSTKLLPSSSWGVSGWPSHLDWRCEAANDRVHQGNRWTRWQKRESSRAGSTARS